MQIINWELVKSPMNWVHIMLMLLIAGIAISLSLTMIGVKPEKTNA